MARSLADEADRGYSPPTPTPKTKKRQTILRNKRGGLSTKMKVHKVIPQAPAAMSVAVNMLPTRLPRVFARVPNNIMPKITPKTTVYVNECRSLGEQVSPERQSSKINSHRGVSVPMEKRRYDSPKRPIPGQAHSVTQKWRALRGELF
jgi:hypothetical protein